MARPLKPLIRGGGYYPSSKWTPLVYAGGMTAMADGGGGEPIDPLNTFSGAIASFKCSEARPIVDMTVAIEPVQAGSGEPSPDNVRPISGWTGANIHVSPTTDAQDGTTYSITFPSAAGTAYGGTLDVTNGKLTVNMTMLGNVNWSKHNSYSHVFYAPLGTGQLVHSTTGVSNVCVLYSGGTLATFASDSKYRFRVGDRIYINIPAASNVTELNTWLTNNSLQICFELATPIVYDLTPTEVTTILGTNNVWADTGDVVVQAYATAL